MKKTAAKSAKASKVKTIKTQALQEKGARKRLAELQRLDEQSFRTPSLVELATLAAQIADRQYFEDEHLEESSLHPAREALGLWKASGYQLRQAYEQERKTLYRKNPTLATVVEIAKPQDPISFDKLLKRLIPRMRKGFTRRELFAAFLESYFTNLGATESVSRDKTAKMLQKWEEQHVEPSDFEKATARYHEWERPFLSEERRNRHRRSARKGTS